MGTRARRGFTLPEVLIVLVVAGVMLSIGVPSFTTFIRNQRVKTASFDIFSSLVVARNEAMTRNTNVTIAPISGAWTNGWSITYVDSTATTQTLRDQQAIPNITITGPASVVYRGSGRLTAAGVQFQLTATGGSVVPRCITVDLSGRPQSKAATC